MAGLSLTGGTAVARTGSTKGWAGLASLPATSTGYLPGDKSQFARFQIVPTSPLPYLPSSLQLVITASFTSGTDTPTLVVDDTVSLGTSSAPTGANAGFGAPVSGSRAYLVDASGFTVSDFNAGSVYLWLGYRSDPTSYSAGNYSVSYSGAGVHDDDGATSAWSGSPPYSVDTGNGTPLPCYADETGELTVQVAGPGTQAFLNVTVTSSATATAFDVEPPSSVCSALATDGFGGSSSSTGSSPRSVSLSTTRKVAVNLSGGTGTTTVGAHARATSTSGPATGRSQASVGVSAEVVSPDASTLTLSLLTLLSIPDGGGGAIGLSLATGTVGAQDEQEMTTLYLGDTLTFWAQLSRYATGEALDATGAVGYRLYEETTDAPVLTGTMTVQDDSNTAGLYRAQASISADNGFEVNKCYCVRVAATVDSVAQAGVVERFVVRSAALSPDSIWEVLDPGDSAGRASTLGGMVRQIWSYCFNRNSIRGSLQTVYRDDSSSVMLQATQTATDTTGERGRME